jgi:DNA replication protein DnaC
LLSFLSRAVHGAGELVQRLQIARRELGLESAIAKLDKYHLLILDDIAYVSKDQAHVLDEWRRDG